MTREPRSQTLPPGQAGWWMRRKSATGGAETSSLAPTYDECTTVEDRLCALKAIPKVALPRKDPVYGIGGPLSKLWTKPR